MNIRIVKSNIKWVLCVAYRKEVGIRLNKDKQKETVAHIEPFLFFTPDLPNKNDRETMMLRLAEILLERMRGRTWSLTAVKVLDFKEFAETIATLVDFSDQFGTAEAWRENLMMLTRQRKLMKNRLAGNAVNTPFDIKKYIEQLATTNAA